MTEQAQTSAASASTSGHFSGDTNGTKRWTKEELLELIASPASFKGAFIKLPCAHCDARATKRFNKSMAVIVSSMVESFWCPDCGRILCEKCRHGSHNCEKNEREKELRKHKTKEQIRAEIEAEQLKKEAVESAAKEAVYAEKVEKAMGTEKRKLRREVMAGKAKMIEDVYQQLLRSPELGDSGSTLRREVEDLWQKLRTLALFLYNEFEHPSVDAAKEPSLLPMAEWREVRGIYEQLVELTGVRVRDPNAQGPGGGEIVMRHDWEDEL